MTDYSKQMKIFIHGFINFKSRNNGKVNKNGETFNYYKWLMDGYKFSKRNDFINFSRTMQSILSKNN